MIARRVGAVPSIVTLDDMKANGRIIADDEDLMVQRLIDAAHVRAEEETGRVFGEGEWIIEADAFEGDVALPLWPVNSILAFTLGGVAVDASAYTITRAGRLARLKPVDAWASGPAVITVLAGEPMPETVKQGVLMLACYWFDQRNAASPDDHREVPFAFSALIGLNRRMFA